MLSDGVLARSSSEPQLPLSLSPSQSPVAAAGVAHTHGPATMLLTALVAASRPLATSIAAARPPAAIGCYGRSSILRMNGGAAPALRLWTSAS